MSGVALVLGGASCVWEDVRGVESLVGGPWPGVVVAINDAGVAWRGAVDHWVTLHPEKMAEWRRQREAFGLPPAGTHWCHKLDRRAERIDRSYSGNVRMVGGSSGLLAVGVALDELGCRSVLCGVPMDERPNEFTGRPWGPFSRYREAWRRSAERLAPHVRSMSGWTRELFGPPDEAFLAEAGPQGETTKEETVP